MKRFRWVDNGKRRIVPFWTGKEGIWFSEPEIVPVDLAERKALELIGEGAVSVVVQRKEKVVWEEEITYRPVDKGAIRE